MNMNIKFTPWDSEVFGMATYELEDASNQTLSETTDRPGHFTVKVEPLSSKQPLHHHNFYYCDTLLKPYCRKEHFHPYKHEDVSLTEDDNLEDLLAAIYGAFRHGRFHRDFNVENRDAHNRYNRWLKQLYEENEVWGFRFKEELAGLVAIQENGLPIYALEEGFRGKGLGKYFMASVCEKLFLRGYEEVHTSVSACNIAMINTVTSVGFKMREAQDVYHKCNPSN